MNFANIAKAISTYINKIASAIGAFIAAIDKNGKGGKIAEDIAKVLEKIFGDDLNKAIDDASEE